MKNLYYARCDNLIKHMAPGVAMWSKIYNIIPTSVSMVDRAGNIKMPFRFDLYQNFVLPRDLTSFDLSYEQCCEKRAWEITQLARKIDKPITIFYSGGIDSTMVLISFMKILSPAELRNTVRVALSIDSIYENPNFYYNYVRKLCTIYPSEQIGSLIDGSSIIVGGELNDQLFGSDLIAMIYKQGLYNQVHEAYSESFMVNWFTMSMGHEAAKFWYDLFTQHISNFAPCDIKTNYDFIWWYNFVFKWQTVYFRMLTCMDQHKRHLLDHSLLSNYHHFYNSNDFQKWSMLNPGLKIGRAWNDYKYECKKVIYNFNRDENYRDNKTKIGSLGTLFYQRAHTHGITTTLEHLENVSAEEFYNSDNSFG